MSACRDAGKIMQMIEGAGIIGVHIDRRGQHQSLNNPKMLYGLVFDPREVRIYVLHVSRRVFQVILHAARDDRWYRPGGKRIRHCARPELLTLEQFTVTPDIHVVDGEGGSESNGGGCLRNTGPRLPESIVSQLFTAYASFSAPV
jgi:hypothetical protein